MKDKSPNLTYGLKDGIITHISKVDNGLECGCFCPACGDKLIAKKGNVKKHHFAHHSKVFCKYGLESSLHMAAKEIISTASEFSIPEVKLVFPYSYRPDIILHDSMKVKIDRVELEKRIDTIIPDVVVYCGGKKFFVEIFVTHAIDDRKRQKIRATGVSAIEIDLSEYEEIPDENELANLILEDNPHKVWIYNTAAEKMLQKYMSHAKKMPIKIRGMARHVDNCPKKMRVWSGKIYANAIDDCLNCESLIAWEDLTDYLYCLGNTPPLSFEKKKAK